MYVMAKERNAQIMTTTSNTNAPIALVTGASHGIGTEVVRQLAQQGMTVILTARNSSQGTTATNSLTGEGLAVIFKPLDVTSDESVTRLATEIEQQFGRLDILINNAATNFDYQELTLNADLDQVRATLETNLLGAWRMSKAFLPLLQKAVTHVLSTLEVERVPLVRQKVYLLIVLQTYPPILSQNSP